MRYRSVVGNVKDDERAILSLSVYVEMWLRKTVMSRERVGKEIEDC